MDRIRTIVSWHWRASWRRVLNARHLNAGNQAVLLIFAVLAAIRYLQALRTAAYGLAQGESQGFGALFSILLLVWMFPVVTSARSFNSLQKLGSLPLTVKELFTVRFLMLLMSPYAWIIVALSVATCYPVARAPNPLAGILAAVFFITFAFFIGLTISHLLRSRFWRVCIFSVLLSLGAAAIILLQSPSRERVFWVGSRGPISLAANAAVGVSPWLEVIELALLMAGAALAAYWSFIPTLGVTSARRSQRLSLFNLLRIPGPLGVLSAKDLRYFRRLLDPYLGVLVCILGSFYVLMADTVSAGLLQIWCLVVVVPGSSLALNLFGLDDRAGFERIRIMPLTGEGILFSKHLAFLFVVGPQVLPLILLGSWRLGPALGAILVLEAVATAAIFLAWGNWTSINHPFKMHSFEFSNSGGLVVEALTGLLFGSLPAIIGVYLVHVEGMRAMWKIAAVALVCVAIDLGSTRYAAARWAKREDDILKALS